ncbi:MAG: TetR/AcrR family transcriptional regulator [Lachnospiraceae bacterium]
MDDLKKKKDTLPPKVAAMYQAVYDLLLEDVDLTKVKVSDITSKAGIGKGTAYEYFESKEDIIAGAICEYLNNLTRIVEDRMYSKDTFMDAMEYLFSIFEEFCGSKEQNVFMKIILLCLASAHTDFAFKLHQKFQKRNQLEHRLPSPEDMSWECMDRLVEKGVQSGEVRKDIPMEYISFSITGKIVTFMMYFTHSGDQKFQSCPLSKTKELLLEEIRRNFINPEWNV